MVNKKEESTRLKTSRTSSYAPSNYTLDNHIAHKLSELTSCSAPEISEDSNWVNSFILNSIFRYKLDQKIRAYLFNFLRRCMASTSAYRAGIENLNEYIETPKHVISPYFRSLSEFEVCISQCYQGYELLAKCLDKKVFIENDCPEKRLEVIYVDSKHMDKMIHGEKLPQNATSGVWIENDGIGSARGYLPFRELHCLLRDMHAFAEQILELGPKK